MYQKKTIEKAVRLYQEGKTVDKVASLMHIPPRTIARWIKRAGVGRGDRRRGES